ncbi:MAG: hypothetical protein K6F52_06775 [Clostridia bacterium]|nr:hypothetical protein [Clostridia bacterium]
MPGVMEAAGKGLVGMVEKGILYICAEDGSELYFQVQFNPSTIGYFASSEPVAVNSYRQQRLKDMHFYVKARPIQGMLQLKIMFDDTMRFDCFSQEKINLASMTPNPTEVAKAAATAFRKMSGGGSVKEQLCALSSLLISPEVEYVGFIWNELKIVGSVSEAQTSFDMFSPSGEPVRGSILLRIRESVNHREVVTKMALSFSKVFKENKADARSATSKVENILNLNL